MYRFLIVVLIAIGLTGLACAQDNGSESNHLIPELSLFRDGISHWQKKNGRDRNDPRFDPSQYVEIANNLVGLQNDDGGWSKDIDWLAQIPRKDLERLHGDMLGRSTFDNHNTYPQIEYLAKVYNLTGNERFRESSERGLDYLLREQRESGGWRGWDVDAITFNDGVMTGIMGMLLDIQNDADHFRWLGEARRDRAEAALDRGIRVTLKCQIEIDGEKTAWCQQHDHTTLKPVQARTYELPSITAQESVDVVRFLKRIHNPSLEIRESIESALKWFRSSAITGYRLERVPIEPVRFENHTATQDVALVEDPSAPPLWARFYDLKTGKPIFCNRDGKVVGSLSEVALERRTGYAWYGYWPSILLQ
ncbi:MAG: pectate lyase [Candidatus Omnitrophica bacterium]|nr:pectate lyase [Candidatus Omnitrophota bacterium]